MPAGLNRILSAAHSLWVSRAYPFARCGSKLSIHHSVDFRRASATAVALGDDVTIGREVWLNIIHPEPGAEPRLILGDRCKIGRRSVISCKNRIELASDVLLAPSVLIMDHNHEFSDPDAPIHAQGLTAGGTIRIEPNCWLGFGAVIVCGRGELVIGRNSVIGANAVVTRSVPARSVVAGNPARSIRRFSPRTERWEALDDPATIWSNT